MPRLKKSLPLLLFLTASICRADSASRLEAEKLFLAGDFEKARAAFQTELKAAPNAAALPPVFYYNYGTTLARAGMPGEAYVNLLRAGFALPFDSDVRANLAQVEQKVAAATLAVRPVTWLDFWPRGLRTSPWQLWLSAALLASALALLLSRQKDRAYMAFAGGISLLLFFVAGMAWLQVRDPIYGVIAPAKLKSGPANTYSDIGGLDPGSLVNQEAEKDGWLKVRFLRGEMGGEVVGWVEPSVLLQVR